MDEPVGVASETVRVTSQPSGYRGSESRVATVLLLVVLWVWLAFSAWAVVVMAALGVWGCEHAEPCDDLFLGTIGTNLGLHLLGGIATSFWAWRSASTAGAIAKCLAGAIVLPLAAFGVAAFLFT